MKVIIVAMLIAIAVSLFSALAFLLRDQGHGQRMARALTWRIGLSLLLFVLLMLGYLTGAIPPQGVTGLH
jgi:Protein of unknown function (DUF2909)